MWSRTERPQGLLGKHQLDVRCRRPDGARPRLVIECKHIGAQKKVGQDVLLKLAQVQARLGAEHAAVITTTAFTRGARAIAVDHDIALIRLRPYDGSIDDGTWVKAVEIEMKFGFRAEGSIELLTDHKWVTAEEARAPAEAWMESRPVDGTASLSIGDLFASGSIIEEDEKVTKKELVLTDSVEIECSSGWMRVDGLRWTEPTVWATEHVRTEAVGEPRLVLQQVDGTGDPTDGRVVVTSKLEAWELDDRVHRVRRRRLL